MRMVVRWPQKFASKSLPRHDGNEMRAFNALNIISLRALLLMTSVLTIYSERRLRHGAEVQ